MNECRLLLTPLSKNLYYVKMYNKTNEKTTLFAIKFKRANMEYNYEISNTEVEKFS